MANDPFVDLLKGLTMPIIDLFSTLRVDDGLEASSSRSVVGRSLLRTFLLHAS